MKKAFAALLLLICATLSAQDTFIPVLETHEPMQTGKYEPTWESLAQYKTPDWFKNAKFGIWAH